MASRVKHMGLVALIGVMFAAMALTFTGCNKEKSMVGTWKLQSKEVAGGGPLGDALSLTVPAEFTLNEDKTAKFGLLPLPGLKWKWEKNTLSFLKSDGTPVLSCPVEKEGKNKIKMTIEMAGGKVIGHYTK